tara:strand:- start:3186 stop:3353 length:168 start_codon:yes stop_codon:yes gene_type:complete
MREYSCDTEITLVIPITVEAKNKKEAKEQALETAYNSYHFGECVRKVRVDTIEKY